MLPDKGLYISEGERNRERARLFQAISGILCIYALIGALIGWIW